MKRPLALSAVLIASAIIGLPDAAEADNAAPQPPRDNTPWTIPETPERCTHDEADSGDVAHCLLAFYADPADTGWGQPPAPGVGEGWNWQGHTYQGSAALAEWEATQIAANTEAVAVFEPGQLQTHVSARALFEGFLQDIHDGGYIVHGASGYSFRCTSGNGGWSCPSGDPDDLSNHAYGLAIDMNAGTNPIRRYEGLDGATACATPMQTDLPRWVIETAERWGLYWGGYGWNNGCADASTQRTSVYRDPPHFEFRGTPEQAAAIAAFNHEHDPRRRCFDTVDDTGDLVEQCNLSGVPEAGWRLPVTVDAPEGTAAVMINLTATGATAYGFFTLEDCGPADIERATSALTFAPGDTVATMAVVPLDEARTFCVYRSTAAHSLVDVVGFLVAGETLPTAPDPDPPSDESTQPSDPADDGTGDPPPSEADDPTTDPTSDTTPDPTADEPNPDDSDDPAVDTTHTTHAAPPADGRLWLRPAPPTRLTDTRHGGTCNPFQECHDGPLRAGNTHAVPTDDAPARLANIAVIGGGEPGFLQAGGCDIVGPDQAFSNLNYLDRSVRSNLALVSADDTGSCVFALSDAHVIVDELGTLAADAGLGWQLQAAERRLDTRQCSPTWCNDRPAAGEIIELDLGVDAPAAAIAITVTQTEAPGFVWAGRCDTIADGSTPTTSNVNYMTDQTVTNMAIVGLDAGKLCVYVSAGAHLVVDLQATLTPERTVGLTPAEPTRAHDSREQRAATDG